MESTVPEAMTVTAPSIASAPVAPGSVNVPPQSMVFVAGVSSVIVMTGAVLSMVIALLVTDALTPFPEESATSDVVSTARVNEPSPETPFTETV